VRNADNAVEARSAERRALRAELAVRDAAAREKADVPRLRAEAEHAAAQAGLREAANAALRAQGHSVTAADGIAAARRKIASRRPGGFP
jgi:hypothetical protein